jgi:hypothetical protein
MKTILVLNAGRLCKRVLPSGKSWRYVRGDYRPGIITYKVSGYTDSQSAASAERVSPPCDDSYGEQHRLAPPVDPKLHRRRLAMSPVEQLVL